MWGWGRKRQEAAIDPNDVARGVAMGFEESQVRKALEMAARDGGDLNYAHNLILEGRVPVAVHDPATITVHHPVKDEQWVAGTDVTIKWSSNRPTMPVEIAMVVSGSAQWCHTYITRATENSGSFTWTVPRDLENGWYWLGVRAIPFDSTRVEGAGPANGFFQVVGGKSLSR